MSVYALGTGATHIESLGAGSAYSVVKAAVHRESRTPCLVF